MYFTGGNNFSAEATITSADMKALIARSIDDATVFEAVPHAGANGMKRSDCAVALARAYRGRLHLP